MVKLNLNLHLYVLKTIFIATFTISNGAKDYTLMKDNSVHTFRMYYKQ